MSDVLFLIICASACGQDKTLNVDKLAVVMSNKDAPRDAVQTQSDICERNKTNKPTRTTIKYLKKTFQAQTTERLCFSTQGTAQLWQCKHPLLLQIARDSRCEYSLYSSHEYYSGKISLVLSSQPGNKHCANQQEKQSINQPLFLSPCLLPVLSHISPKAKGHNLH